MLSFESPKVKGCHILYADIIDDHRGYFIEKISSRHLENLGLISQYKQTNYSFSRYNVLRGLHLQKGQTKLVSCLTGRILDVIVDLRPDSPTYKQYDSFLLDSSADQTVYVPDGCAHGFVVLSRQGAEVLYQVSSLWDKEKELSINPFDKDLKIFWGLGLTSLKEHIHILSEKDQNAPFLVDIEKYL